MKAALTELYQYRDLLLMLAWRDVRRRYKETVMGALWAPWIGR